MKKKSLAILTVGLSLASNIHIIFANSEVPTGDDTTVMPYILLLAAAAAIGVGVLFWYNKKKQ